MTFSLSAIAIVPSLCYTFYQAMVLLFDIASGLMTFYWNIMVFVVEIMREMLNVFGPAFSHVMPVLYFYTRDLYESVKGVAVELWRNLHMLAHQGEEGFLVMWGAVVACFYVFWNQILEAVRGNPQEQERNDMNGDNYNYNERPVQNQRLTRNRLYPNLDDIDSYINNNNSPLNDMNQNENAEDNRSAGLRQRNGGLQQRDLYPQGNDNRICVVCFERDRDTALFPCGHTHTCMQCTLAITRNNNLCPLCQQRIREYRRIFV